MALMKVPQGWGTTGDKIPQKTGMTIKEQMFYTDRGAIRNSSKSLNARTVTQTNSNWQTST